MPSKIEIAKALLKKISKKVPYKVIAKDGDITLKSPKASVHAEFRDPDTVELLDPEMSEYLADFSRPVYISSVEAEKGYGSKALKQIEASAKKRGADSAYLNASPLGGTRGLSQEDAAAKLKEFYKKNGYEIANDQGTNAMMYKKLGVGAMPFLGSEKPQMKTPTEYLGDLLGKYNEAKDAVAGRVAKQIDISKDPGTQDTIKNLLSFGADPINMVSGGAGVGLNAAMMMADDSAEKKKQAIMELRKGMYGK